MTPRRTAIQRYADKVDKGGKVEGTVSRLTLPSGERIDDHSGTTRVAGRPTGEGRRRVPDALPEAEVAEISRLRADASARSRTA
ncbi:hypothetical protein ACT17Q_04980 [Cellulomonas sp. CW35]|uniref:hypothetical protein n=1 Tax=Cellulomonas sp. CW35 TaxID=3458249 RepID=UPI004034DE91